MSFGRFGGIVLIWRGRLVHPPQYGYGGRAEVSVGHRGAMTLPYILKL
jgi:hypothetical protein